MLVFLLLTEHINENAFILAINLSIFFFKIFFNCLCCGYLFLVDDSSKHKIPKDVNKIVVARISLGEYKYIFLNDKCLKNSIIESTVKIAE